MKSVVCCSRADAARPVQKAVSSICKRKADSYDMSTHQTQDTNSTKTSSEAHTAPRSKKRNRLQACVWQLMLIVGLVCCALPLSVGAQGAVKSGKVVAWGMNDLGQRDVPNAAAQGDVIAIAAFSTENSLALLSNGTVVVWGDNTSELMNVPVFPGSVIAIAEGFDHGLALLQDGTVTAWGNNTYNQCSVPPSIQGFVTAIAAGVQHSLALQKNRAVVAWGDDSYLEQNRIEVPQNIQGFATAIAAGCWHNLALLTNNNVRAWGHNADNQLQVPETIQGQVIAIAAGCWHSLALLRNGTVVQWGGIDQGVPNAIQGRVVAIAGSTYNSMALLNDGTVTVWGDNSYGQSDVPPAIQGNVISIAAGQNFSLAIVNASIQFPSPNTSPSTPSGLPPNPLPNPPPASPSALPPNPPSPRPIFSPSPLPQSPQLLSPSPPTPPAPVPAPTAPTSLASSTKSSSVAGIAGGAVGGGVLVILVVVVMLWLRNKKKRSNDIAMGKNGGLMGRDGAAGMDYQDNNMSLPLATITVSKSDGKAETSAKHTTSSSHIQPYTGSASGLSAGVAPHWTYSAPYTVTDSSQTQTSVDVTTAVQTRMLGSLRILWSDIVLGQQIGQGGFGTVYVASWQGNRVAVKMLNKEHLSQDARAALHNEVLMMCELRHPCIAPAYGLVDEGEHHALVMRYYRRGTLAAAMRTMAYLELDLGARLKIALQVATGIRRLHEAQPRPIIHGDLKTSNILLEDDASWRVVISDFGLACSVRTSNGQGPIQNAPHMTISISPPEVLQNPYAPRTLAVDSYAFAIVLVEILQGAPLYQGMKAKEVVSAVSSGRRPGIPATIPDDIAALIKACWSQDPAKRPGFKACTDTLQKSIDEHSGPGHDFMNTTTFTRTEPWF